MSDNDHMNDNDDDDRHNHNHNHQPPKKKRKVYKRYFSSHEEFVVIIAKLAKQYDGKLFTCLEYVHEHGVYCSDCDADKKLNGHFTKQKYAKTFNFSTLKSHIWSDKHINRISSKAVKDIHPKLASHNASDNDNANSSKHQTPIYIPTEYDRIINSFGLLHLKIKLGQPFNHLKAENKFIDLECKGAISPDLTSWYATDELLDAMNQHQIQCDDKVLLGTDRTNEIALNFDGATHRNRSTKIFFAKTWNEGEQTRFVQCLNGKKSIRDIDVDITDLLTIDSANDNVRLIEKVVNERLKIQWHQLIQLNADGAGQNLGKYNGCATQVCYYIYNISNICWVCNIFLC